MFCSSKFLRKNLNLDSERASEGIIWTAAVERYKMYRHEGGLRKTEERINES